MLNLKKYLTIKNDCNPRTRSNTNQAAQSQSQARGDRFTKQLSNILGLSSFVSEMVTLFPFHKISKLIPKSNVKQKINQLNRCPNSN